MRTSLPLPCKDGAQTGTMATESPHIGYERSDDRRRIALVFFLAQQGCCLFGPEKTPMGWIFRQGNSSSTVYWMGDFKSLLSFVLGD